MKERAMEHYVFENGEIIHTGLSAVDCWCWLVIRYGDKTMKELVEMKVMIV